MKTAIQYPILTVVLFFFVACCGKKVLIPVPDGQSWQVTSMPDLGELTGPNLKKQDIVDHGFIAAANGK